MSYLIEDNSVLNIKRYCSSCNVRGGFTKLLSYFKKLNYIDYAYTFSDNSISDGELYINNGFILNDEVKPDYSYIVGNKRVHKFSFRKGDFKNRTDLLYQDDLTESQLAVINGLYRVYDSGKKKWVCYF